MSTIRALLIVALSWALPTLATADVVKIGVGNQGGETQATAPNKGAHKSSVQAQFGNPKQTYSAVGDPPISRWVFDQFTVYFEYDHVVHSVAHHVPNP